MGDLGKFVIKIDLTDPSWWDDGVLDRLAVKAEVERLAYGILEGRSEICVEDEYTDSVIPMTSSAPSGKSVGVASLILYGELGPHNQHPEWPPTLLGDDVE